MVFGRRQQPQVRNVQPSAAAHTAATQAFLASRASNASLSNSAATAALRSFTASPTPVGDIQTKRMLRRGSTSSHGSAGSGRRPLSRQNSSGSMTERTFRDPSPNRPPSRSGVVYHDDPPPMPALPKAYASPPPSITTRSYNRPSSTEPLQRIRSPPPQPGGRGVSVDRAPRIGARSAKMRNVTPNALSSIDTESNRASVNFSRPMSPPYQFTPPASPLQTKPPPASKAKTPANTAQPRLPSAEAAQIQHQIQNTAAAPVKKKKKVVDATITQGSHLAQGGKGGKPAGTAIDRVTSPKPVEPVSKITPPRSSASPSPASTAQSSPVSIPKKKRKQQTKNVSERYQTGSASDSDAPSERSTSSDRPRQFNTRAAGLLTKQPSVVREDREAEEKEERNMALGSSWRAIVQKETRGGDATHALVTPKPLDSPVQVQEPKVAAAIAPTLPAVAAPKPRPRQIDQEIKAARRTSLSPSAAARFPGSPTTAAWEGSRHEPPPRSISPAKSALKNYRGVSPAGMVPGGWGVASSEASDISSVVSDDGYKNLLAPRRKKNVRVSFEDEPVIVGQSTSRPESPESPVMFSPQDKSGKKGWFGIGKGKKGTTTTDSEAEDGMKPMPTLPSFGSVRKSREEEQNAMSQEELAPPRRLEMHEGSRDLAVGGILAQEHARKVNGPSSLPATSTSSNDRLPPEVTFVEGSGYHSDSSSNAEDGLETRAKSQIEPQETVREPEPKPLPAPSSYTFRNQRPDERQDAIQAKVFPPAQNLIDAKNPPETPGQPAQNLAPVPRINIQPSTPKIGDSTANPIEAWLGMPGGFPVSTDNLVDSPASQHLNGSAPGDVTAHHATDPTPADVGIAEPSQDPVHVTHPPAGTVAELIRHRTSHHHDAQTNDSDSIYSDAAEDLSDLEGDGFGSINAIVESPSFTPVKPSLESPTISPENIGLPAKPAEQDAAASSPVGEGWDKAQAHWAAVSQGRQRPAESLGEEPIQDVQTNAESVLQPTAKTKKKKANTQTQSGQPVQPRPAPPVAAAVPVAARQHRQTSSTASDQPSLRKSMRDPQPSLLTAAQPMKKSMRASQPIANDQPAMRSSMRGPSASEAGQQIRATMRGSPPPKSPLRELAARPKAAAATGSPEARGALQKKTRRVPAVPISDSYQSVPAAPRPSKGAAAVAAASNKNDARVKAQPVKVTPAPRPLRRQSSDSSFTKARPAASDGGKISMRRSMRSTSIERPMSLQFTPSSDNDARSNSLSSDRRPFSTGPSMRTSMRGSIDARSLRGSKPQAATLRANRSSERSAKPSRFSSRFDDSSDEDESAGRYRSRFDDSSDSDNEPAPTSKKLAPVRGIPSRIDEGDSSDLSDSDAEADVAPPPKISLGTKSPPALNTRKAGMPEGAALSSGSLRHAPDNPNLRASAQQRPVLTADGQKKNSFFGRFGRKKADMPPIPEGDDVQTPSPVAAGKAGKLLGGVDSPIATSSPKSPKLQRRQTPQRFASDTWPLREGKGGKGGDRPSTSDGRVANGNGNGVANGRPTFEAKSSFKRGTVRGLDEGARPGLVAKSSFKRGGVRADEGGEVVVGKGGKKKRFPGLRKVFGLHD